MLNRKNTFLIAVFAVMISSSLLAQIRLTPQSRGTSQTQNTEEQNFRRALNDVHNFISRGNFKQAEALLDRLEKSYGENATITNEKKRLLKAKKDFPALLGLIKGELEQSPDNFGITCQLGEAYFLSDSLDKAEATWEIAFSIAGNSPYNYTVLANYYQGYGYYNEAASVYKRGREILGQPGMFLGELADIYISQKNYAQATEEYLRMIQYEKNPRKTLSISRNIAAMYQDADDKKLIIQTLERSLEENKNMPDMYILLGDIYMMEGKKAEAFANYKRGDSLETQGGFYLERFIESCFTSGEYDMAVEAANYFLSKSASDRDKRQVAEQVTLLKAKSLAELGAYQTAFELLDVIENKFISFKARAEAIYTAGEIYADKLNDYSNARQKFNLLVESAGNMPEAMMAQIRLAEFDIYEANFDNARVKLNDVIESGKKSDLAELAYFLLAETYFFEADYKNASLNYNKLFNEYVRGKYVNDCLERVALITEADGDSALVFVSQAARYHFANKPDSAVMALKQALTGGQSSINEYVVFTLPEYYNLSGNWETAIDAYQHYLTSYEDGIYVDRVLFNLALIYREKAGMPDKADELLNRIISEHPNSPLIEKTRANLNPRNAS